MSLAVKDALAHIRHELGGGDLSSELDKYTVLNQAGHHLYSMHAWRWTLGRSALLDLRGVVEGETATWTASSLTLTQASAFTNYTHETGDQISIIDGTGATTGTYTVASKTSANAIVLSSSLSSTNLSTGDIEWRIEPQTIELPADLRDIIAIDTTSISSVGGITLVSIEEISKKRSSTATITASTGLFYGAVVFAGSPKVPILEIWPTPSDNTTGALRIFYRSRWAEVTTDTQQIAIPEWLEDLYLWIARAYAAGYERGNVASIHVRLAEIKGGPIFDAAMRSDGMIQPYLGMVKNGGPTLWRRGESTFLQVNTRIEAPSI